MPYFPFDFLLDEDIIDLMIILKNGHKIDFACASGALGFNGDGWWWEQPARWFGLLDPHAFTIITKTLTFAERKGNLRWWCPWRCVRLLPGSSTVNAVGLTNKGIWWWLRYCHYHIVRRGYKVIVSIAPQSAEEAEIMVGALHRCRPCPKTGGGVYGIQVNVSCPNVDHDSTVDHNIKIIQAALNGTDHPIAVKLGYQDPYIDICKELDNKGVAFFELINAVPWNLVFPDKPSPLAKYGLVGGVSGLAIKPFAREALAKAVIQNFRTPIASGGAINSVEECYARRVMGARAIIMGVAFLRNISEPNKIIAHCRKEWQSEISVVGASVLHQS